MNILVINGSPKGDNSITLQTSNYLAKRYPQCHFEVLNAGQKIRHLSSDFSEATDKIDRADLLIFSYPVYTFIAPYQLHRFIELLDEHHVDISGKIATQIVTSKHFYDVTAIGYVEACLADFGVRYIKPFSADMDDLLSTKGQTEARAYWDNLLYCIDNNYFDKLPIIAKAKKGNYVAKLDVVAKADKYDTLIVTNMTETDTNLANMIADFRAVYPYKTRVVNILDFKFSGGCLGCFNCATSGKCVYKDGYENWLKQEIHSASAIVFAFTIDHHCMGASFKLYDDRQFCNGHRMMTIGMPFGYIVSGNYSGEHNLQTIIEGRAQVGKNNLVMVATDEGDTASQLTELSSKLARSLDKPFVLPQNFLGVGGTKIFRDLIFEMRGMMREDHKFYKKHGIYDFPHNKRGRILQMKLVGTLMRIPPVMKKMRGQMNKFMIDPYTKVINDSTK